mmetsp:Transcript_23529/g.61133  ORF Transcript_23529/g.61133 Transcript_23529/m.61133 type:complete len:210 (-) Transcript_23529:206-835(-)
MVRRRSGCGKAAALLALCLVAASASTTYGQTEEEDNAACDASPTSAQASCETCALTDTPIEYEICCCSPYSALVSTSPNPDTCECTTRAGWALILLAVLVPILIIGDIMLTVYCCYKGRCCCFKPANTENKNLYNVHQGLPPGADPNTPRYSANVPYTSGGPVSPQPVAPMASHPPTIQQPSASRALADGPVAGTPRASEIQQPSTSRV